MNFYSQQSHMTDHLWETETDARTNLVVEVTNHTTTMNNNLLNSHFFAALRARYRSRAAWILLSTPSEATVSPLAALSDACFCSASPVLCSFGVPPKPPLQIRTEKKMMNSVRL